ncbi:response regulator protein TmoT [bacterium BMS3Abin04]|nr:response regulator protein TmoT [bacterium BMS3Abin04]
MNKLNCILIDDETEALDRLESLLTKFEFINILAKIDSAENAVKQIIELKPNLVFIDVEMPRKSGFDIINEVRDLNVNPKFIFVTGYNQYAIKAIRAAAFDFLVKPVDIDELKEALDRFYETQIGKESKSVPKEFIEKHNLSEREVEIIEYLMTGKSSKQIADELCISKQTVDSHRKHILEKTKFHSTTELVGYILGK